MGTRSVPDTILGGMRNWECKRDWVFAVGGIHVDSWVKVEGRRSIVCDVVDDEAQFQFGGEDSSGLCLIVTKNGLEKLLNVGMDALRSMRAELDDHERAESKTA